MADTVPTAAFVQRAQLGVESEWGAVVTTTIALSAIKVNHAIKLDSEAFKGAGAKFPSLIVRGSETGNHTFEGKATYEEAYQFLATIAQGAASAVTKKYTLEVGVPGGQCVRYGGTVVTAWTLKGNDKSVDLSGSMVSKSWVAATMAALGSPVIQTPIENAHIVLTVGSTVASANKNVLDWELAVSNLWALAAVVGSRNPQGINEGDIDGTFSVTVEANSTNIGLITTPRTTQALSIAATSGAMSLTILANVQLQDVEQFSAAGQVYAVKLKYKLVNVVTETTNILTVTPDYTP